MSTTISRTSAFLAFAAATFAASLAGCVVSDGDGSLTVYNESDYVIEHLYLTEVDNPTWGPDLLGSDVLYPGEAISLGVDCDYYDALVVDEFGVECEIYDIDLCLNDAEWVLRNNTCDVFSIAAQARQAEAAAASDPATLVEAAQP